MAKQFTRPLVNAIAEGKILGVRAGRPSDHRFIGIWAVVVDGRVFVRSWTVSKDGWYRAFLEDPTGAIQVGTREVRVRAVPARGERIRDAVEAAYVAKYNTPGALKFVKGFRSARRRDSTMEFVPR